MGFVWVEYDSSLQKGISHSFLTNYISSVLIRKIETMLGMSHKGDLKQGPEGTKKGRWVNSDVRV